MTKPKKPNIYDVAALAEVSHQTVSRVLNGHASIRPETRARVEAAMEALGYRPNQAARALVTNRTKMLGLLVSDTGLYGPAGMLYAMERQARSAGYIAVSIAVRFDSPDSWRDGIAQLQNLGVEGIVIIALAKDALETVIRQFPNTPMVAIDTEDHPRVTGVGINNIDGGELATRHLLELGHTRILHIQGPQHSAEANARRKGYESAMAAAGLETRVVQGDWSADTGFRIGVDLNLDVEPFTAIFAANDHTSLGLLKAFRMRGVEVPERMSIIGFDDIPESSYFYPPLTTVRQDFNQLGEAAMDVLLAQLAGKTERSTIWVAPELVIRESTARLVS